MEQALHKEDGQAEGGHATHRGRTKSPREGKELSLLRNKAPTERLVYRFGQKRAAEDSPERQDFALIPGHSVAEGGRRLAAVLKSACRKAFEYSAASTRVLSAEYADGLRTAPQDVAQGRTRPCLHPPGPLRRRKFRKKALHYDYASPASRFAKDAAGIPSAPMPSSSACDFCLAERLTLNITPR